MNLTDARVCTKCGKEKPAKDFYARKSEKRLYSSCRECFNAYCMRRWIDRKRQYVEEMGGACFDCGGQFHLSVYDFHHLDMKAKEFNWNRLRLRSDAAIRKELKKCVLLCANCHRMRHAMERGGS